MADINLADAKARLSELVAKAEAGESVRISRRGIPVVELRRLDSTRKPIDFSALKALTDARPISDEVVIAARADSRY